LAGFSQSAFVALAPLVAALILQARLPVLLTRLFTLHLEVVVLIVVILVRLTGSPVPE